MSNFTFKNTPIKNLKVINYHPKKDQRGSLSKLFCLKTFQKLIKKKIIKQVNYTITKKKGTVRGMHFQYLPYAENKIITCLKGKVWDVAVDLREGSKTFLHHYAEILTEDNHKSFLIPEGFAHGFQTLTSNCEMLYFHTADYNESLEGILSAIDPLIGIKWPEPIIQRSKRDRNCSFLTKDFKGIKV
jgi:dTDP-4-dehydrorhamnose 3,5-epimerase